MDKKTIAVGLLAVTIIGGGGYYLYNKSQNSTPNINSALPLLPEASDPTGPGNNIDDINSYYEAQKYQDFIDMFKTYSKVRTMYAWMQQDPTYKADITAKAQANGRSFDDQLWRDTYWTFTTGGESLEGLFLAGFREVSI